MTAPSVPTGVVPRATQFVALPRAGEIWRPKAGGDEAQLAGEGPVGVMTLHSYQPTDGQNPTGAPFTLSISTLTSQWERVPERIQVGVKQVWRNKTDGMDARVMKVEEHLHRVQMARPGVGLQGPAPVSFSVRIADLRTNWDYVGTGPIKYEPHPAPDSIAETAASGSTAAPPAPPLPSKVERAFNPPVPVHGTCWRRNSDGLIARAVDGPPGSPYVVFEPLDGTQSIASPIEAWRDFWTLHDAPVPAAPQLTSAKTAREHGHYFFDVSHLKEIDIYRMIQLLQITDPALQHAFKKVAMAGRRGAKDTERDAREAIDSINRFLQMRAEDCNVSRDESGSASIVSADPHAAVRRTWAPGQRWQVRWWGHGEWEDHSDTPKWLVVHEYRRHPDDFTPWSGKHSRGPEKLWGVRGARVNLKYRDGSVCHGVSLPDLLNWGPSGSQKDIVGYQIVSLP